LCLQGAFFRKLTQALKCPPELPLKSQFPHAGAHVCKSTKSCTGISMELFFGQQ
jgi:hypothetical protein